MRYFFDFIDSTDLVGATFRSDEAARQEAIFRSADGGDSNALRTHSGRRHIRVRDSTGRIVCTVRT